MTYFKHYAKMRNDPKIRRVIAKYGIEGYGLYCLVIETIVERITTEQPVPELEETCEDLAEIYNGNTAKINEIMSYMINQGLFELSEISMRVTCSKIYKYLEQNQTRSVEIRKLIAAYTSCHDLSETVRDICDRTEQNRIEQNINTNMGPAVAEPTQQRFKKPTFDEVQAYCRERNNTVNPLRFIDHYESKGWKVGKTPMKDWKASVRTWETSDKPNAGGQPKVLTRTASLDLREV